MLGISRSCRFACDAHLARNNGLINQAKSSGVSSEIIKATRMA